MGNYRYTINPHTGRLQKVLSDDYIQSIISILNFEAGVATVGDLPSSGNAENDARFVNDTHHLYIWNGSSWQDQGDIIDIDWSVITNKPTSTVGDIDDAVTKKHDKLHSINDITNHTGISGTGIEDNFMAIDANGLPKDSEKNASDFANSIHSHLEGDITDLDHYDSADFSTDFSGADLANLSGKSYDDLTDKPDLSDLHFHTNKVELDLVTDGNHDIIVTGNPHDVKVEQLDLATGTIASDVDDAVSHKDLTDNPHEVSSAQVGTYTQAEINALDNKAKCIEITLSGNANNYLFTKTSAYTVLTRFVFKGTTILGSPTNIKMIVHVKTALKPGDVRVYDLTNANAICEATGISSLVPIIVDLGTLSNLPSGEAMFEVQAKDPLADEVYVSGLIIEF